MFELFKRAKKFVNGDKAASRVTTLLAPCLIPAMQPHGGVDPKLMSDEFFVAYVYGAISVTLDALGVTDDAETGIAILQVFDRLFPDQGVSVTEFCGRRVIEKNTEFMRSCKLGFREMFDVLKSEGQTTPQSLIDHICEIYLV